MSVKLSVVFATSSRLRLVPRGHLSTRPLRFRARGRPFIPEPSQKCIDQEGLERRRTETRKRPTDSPELVAVPFKLSSWKARKKTEQAFYTKVNIRRLHLRMLQLLSYL